MDRRNFIKTTATVTTATGLIFGLLDIVDSKDQESDLIGVNGDSETEMDSDDMYSISEDHELDKRD